MPKWALPALCGALFLVGGLYGTSCYLRHKASVQAQQADQHQQAAIIHAAQGATYDQQAEAQQPTLNADASEVARLRAEVARLRRPDPRPDPTPTPGQDDPQPIPPPVDLAPLVAKQDELIGALTKENADLKANALTITASRDSWRSGCLESQKDAACLRIAHEAQLAAIKAERWKGRLEGGGAALTVEVLRRVITGGW